MAVGGFPVNNPYRHEESLPMSKDTTQHSVCISDAGEKSNAAVDTQATATTILTPTVPKIEAAPDPFDPARFRLSQHNLAAGSVKKQLTIIPVRKPSKEQFVRCHPDQAFRIETLVLELKEDREIYLIEPTLWAALDGESTVSPRLLITSQTKQGTIFLWPIRLPGPDGRLDDWNRSSVEAATLATTSWVRVQSNMALGAYDVFKASSIVDDPEWDLPSFSEVLKIAFKDKLINDINHPVLRRLRGES
jgi:hypothetical protein